jgi:prepilin-type processing-associated H-X9-DG protein
MYANDNKGCLVECYNYPDYSRGFYTNFVKDNGIDYFTSDRVYHAGRLVKTRYLKTGEVAYCPGNNYNKDFSWDIVGSVNGTPWPQVKTLSFTGAYRSSYSYNPHWMQRTGSVTRIQGYRRLADVGKHRTIALDMPYSVNELNHGIRTSRPGWNLAFADGHVQYVVSQEVLNQMAANGSVGSGNASQTWNRLDNYRDMLETLAFGGNLLDNPLGYGSVTVNRVTHYSGELRPGTSTVPQ